MSKKTFIEKVTEELEKRKISNRSNFLSKSFVNPHDDNDGEMTLVGSQISVVLADSIDLKYKFYKIDVNFLKDDLRDGLIQKIKAQYPGIIFYICDCDSKNSTKTIDTENNMIVFDNEDFDAAVELCGGVDKFFETML